MFLFYFNFFLKKEVTNPESLLFKKRGGVLELQGFNLKNKIRIEIKERELHRRSDSDLKNNPRNT